MSRGEMHIVNKNQERVATLSWDGSLWDGKGTWRYRDKKVRRQIEAAVAKGKEELTYRVPDMLGDAAKVPMWKGFSGMYGGLNLVLPAFGMEIDLGTVWWPGDEEKPAK